ncbi:MAG: hypothetical protein ACK55Z_28765 [bacterium]
MQKNNCIAMLQGPGKKSRTYKNKTNASGPGKQILTCKKTSELHCYLVPASKTRHTIVKMHFTLPVPANTSRTYKGYLHCTALLPAWSRLKKPDQQIPCTVAGSWQEKSGHSKEQLHFNVAGPRKQKQDAEE